MAMNGALSVIAEPRRLEILRLVWDREMAAGDIAGRFEVTFGAISQHLGVLREAGLVAVRRVGKKRMYRARRESLGALAPALESMWAERLGTLKRLAEEQELRDGDR
jgi:DNA-binding transcriptional ArsR family regulator